MRDANTRLWKPIEFFNIHSEEFYIKPTIVCGKYLVRFKEGNPVTVKKYENILDDPENMKVKELEPLPFGNA